jgi:integrase
MVAGTRLAADGSAMNSNQTFTPERAADRGRVRGVGSGEKRTKLTPAFVPDLRLTARTTPTTLLRLSEVLGLRREDIGQTEIVVVNSKSGAGRKVPLPEDLRALLLARCHDCTGPSRWPAINLRAQTRAQRNRRSPTMVPAQRGN